MLSAGNCTGGSLIIEKGRKTMSETRNHTFVICAYKESPYLEECIQSIQAQSVSSVIGMATSTPCAYIEEFAAKYEIPLWINEGETGITQDWNFAISKADTRFVTLAHQDDIYEPEYTRTILEPTEQLSDMLISFCNYGELRNGKKVFNNSLLKVKNFMLLPLRFRPFWKSRFVRRRILSLGDPICCPAVTFHLDRLTQPIFEPGFRSCEDWLAWEKLSRLKGAFIYRAQPLMCHRIHEESATTAILQDHARIEENYIMFCKFWPKPIARLLNHFYTKSEDSNQLNKE